MLRMNFNVVTAKNRRLLVLSTLSALHVSNRCRIKVNPGKIILVYLIRAIVLANNLDSYINRRLAIRLN